MNFKHMIKLRHKLIKQFKRDISTIQDKSLPWWVIIYGPNNLELSISSFNFHLTEYTNEINLLIKAQLTETIMLANQIIAEAHK